MNSITLVEAPHSKTGFCLISVRVNILIQDEPVRFNYYIYIMHPVGLLIQVQLEPNNLAIIFMLASTWLIIIIRCLWLAGIIDPT